MVSCDKIPPVLGPLLMIAAVALFESGASHVYAFQYLLEGNSVPKVSFFLFLLGFQLFTYWIINQQSASKSIDPVKLCIIIFILSSLSNIIHVICIHCIGLPIWSEVFLYDHGILNGDSTFHTHVGKTALSMVLSYITQEVYRLHSGILFVHLYPKSLIIVELLVVLTAIILVPTTSDPRFLIGLSLMSFSVVDGGVFSLPDINGVIICSLICTISGRKGQIVPLIWLALTIPFLKMTLGALCTYYNYGKCWKYVKVYVKENNNYKMLIFDVTKVKSFKNLVDDMVKRLYGKAMFYSLTNLYLYV